MRGTLKKILLGASCALLPLSAMANTPAFSNVTAGDFDKIVKELSANFSYSSVTPASSLGGLWGFELGVAGGITKTPEILALVKRNSPSFKEDKFPHAGALLRIGAPLGLTAEAMILPEITVSDLKLHQYAGAVQWTITDVFFSDLPLNLAVKGYYTKTGMTYKQVVNNSSTGNTNVDATIGFDNSTFGGQFLVSKKLLVFEPYVGIGYAKAKGELGVTASGNVPNTSIFLSGARSLASNPTSAQLIGGLDLRLFFFSLGAEYQKAFGTSTFNGRLSFRF